MRLLGKERERSERLLLNILPAAPPKRLKASEAAIAEHSTASRCFSDIVRLPAIGRQALVDLNQVFSEFE